MPKSQQPADPGRESRRDLLKYAGLSTELAASMGLSLFIGIRADKWLRLSFPVFAWALPLLVIVVLIVKLVKESSKRRNGK